MYIYAYIHINGPVVQICWCPLFRGPLIISLYVLNLAFFGKMFIITRLHLRRGEEYMTRSLCPRSLRPKMYV